MEDDLDMDGCRIDWFPDSFARPPEWRWLRAESLAAGDGPAPPDDPWVGHARTAIRGGGGPRSRAAAVRAARAVREGDPARRGELEALLTTLPLAEIARRCCIATRVVEAYEAVFFAVRAMRGAGDWLLARAVGYSPATGFTGPLPASSWKLAAQAGGPVVLDLVLAATTGRPLPPGYVSGDGPDRAAGEARLRLLARLWVASMPAVTDAEFARVVAARRRVQALDQAADGPGPDPTQTAMEAFLLALPRVTRAGKRRSKGAGGRLKPVAGSGSRPVGSMPDGRKDGRAEEGRTTEGSHAAIELGRRG